MSLTQSLARSAAATSSIQKRERGRCETLFMMTTQPQPKLADFGINLDSELPKRIPASQQLIAEQIVTLPPGHDTAQIQEFSTFEDKIRKRLVKIQRTISIIKFAGKWLCIYCNSASCPHVRMVKDKEKEHKENQANQENQGKKPK
jgi:hypothetical protein